MKTIETTYPINAESFGGVMLPTYPHDCGWHFHRTLRGYLRTARRHPAAKVVLLTGHRDSSGTQIGRVEIRCSDLLEAASTGNRFVRCSVIG